MFKVHYEETGGSGDNFAANAGAPPAEGGSNKNVNGSSKSNDITNKVREVRYYVRLRPGLTKFLEKTSALYEVGPRGGFGRLRWRRVLLPLIVEVSCSCLLSAHRCLNERIYVTYSQRAGGGVAFCCCCSLNKSGLTNFE